MMVAGFMHTLANVLTSITFFLMARRSTLAELLYGTLILLLLAMLLLPAVEAARERDYTNVVASIAASADGLTFAAQLVGGKVIVWDSEGTPKATWQSGRRPC